MNRRFAIMIPLSGLLIAHCVHAQLPTTLPVVRTMHHPDSLHTGTWPDSARRAMLDSLAAGRQRWDRQRPAEYLIASYSTDNMVAIESTSDSYAGWLVRGDSLIRRIAIHPATFDKWRQWLANTIDRTFAIVEHAARDSAYQVDLLELDPHYGFPIAWHVDDAQNRYSSRFVTDRGYGARVELFTADPRAWRCSWWRRLLRCGLADQAHPVRWTNAALLPTISL